LPTATLDDQRRSVLEAAKSIVDTAKSEQRTMTEDERTKVTEHMSKADELAAQIKQADEDGKVFDALGKALSAGTSAERADEKPTAKTLGEAFTTSDAYLDAVTQAKAGGRFTTRPVDTGIKALTAVSGGLGGLNVGGYQELPRQDLSLLRPTIASLFAQGTMTGSILTYLRESPVTNGAATVAESGVKPQSNLTLTRVSHVITKIATWMDVPDEVLEDLDAARSYIDGRLMYFVQIAEETQLLTGDGTGANMTGILNTSGILTKTTTAGITARDNMETVYNAAADIRDTAFMEPDAVVVNPNDYRKFRLAADANGQYYGGGPFAGQYGVGGMLSDPPIWGLRTVVTPSMAEGTALVGSFQLGGQVWRKGGITVDATNSDADKFRSNITTIRAEERVGLAVYRPTAFSKVTFDWTA
jgi:HK97 family phage major capsid protein